MKLNQFKKIRLGYITYSSVKTNFIQLKTCPTKTVIELGSVNYQKYSKTCTLHTKMYVIIKIGSYTKLGKRN